jgi:hypothetical protein
MTQAINSSEKKVDRQIKIPGFPYDMRDWCVEKSSHIVKVLSSMIDCLNETRDEVPEETREQLIDYISPAIYDATKIMAVSCQGNWEPGDRDLIVKTGRKGYSALSAKYGLEKDDDFKKMIRETQSIEKAESMEMLSLMSKMLEILKMPRGEARTIINILLDELHQDNTVFQTFNSLTNQVNMGEITWEEYIATMNRVIEQYQVLHGNE